MTLHNVLGLDVSLARTGWAVLTWNEGDLVDCGVITPPIPKSGTDIPVEALRDLRHRIHWDVLGPVDHGPFADVGIEGGFAGGSGWGTRMLASAAAVVALSVYGATHIEPMSVAPSSVKKLATGRGDADKAEVIAAARARWPECPEDSDMADACWVAEAVRVARGAGMDVEVAG